MTDENKFEPVTHEIRIGAGWVVHHLRRMYQESSPRTREIKVIKEARLCGFDPALLSDEQIVKIAGEAATLRGYSPPGFSYHDESCAACKGTGKQVCPTSPTKRVDLCPACEGDGFSPAVAEMDYRQPGYVKEGHP